MVAQLRALCGGTVNCRSWALRSICAHEDQRDHPSVRRRWLEAEACLRLPSALCSPDEAWLVTVAGKPSAPLKPKTESSILKQAGLRKERP